MGVILLGFPNHASEGYHSVTTTGAVGLVPTLMGAEKLYTEEPTERARLTTVDPQHTQWGFGTSGVEVTIDGFSLVNHNIADGGQVRFVGSILTTGINSPSISRPNGTPSSSNATGTHANVDEDIYTPDGLVIAPTITTDPWSVVLDFQTPSGTISPQPGRLCFVVVVRRVFVGAGATDPLTLPKCECSLEEVGPGFVKALGYRAVTVSSSAGQIFIFPFDKADLQDATGAGIRCGLSFLPGTSTSGSQYAVADSVALYYETTTTSFGLDSGWIDVEGDTIPSPIQPTKSIHYVPDAPWENVVGYTVMIRSDQAQHEAATTTILAIPAGAVLRDPSAFVQAGVVCVGGSLTLEDGLLDAPYAPATRVIVNEIVGNTSTGMTYGAESFRRRVSDPIDLVVSRAELKLIQDRIAWRRGHSGAFYAILEPGVPIADQMMSSFWCTVRDVSSPVWMGNDGGIDKYKISVTFEEKL